jgi:membrane protein DedA with SNARE-associated domain
MSTAALIFQAIVLAVVGGMMLYYAVGTVYHGRRKRRGKKRVRQFHEDQAREAAGGPENDAFGRSQTLK